MQWREASTVNCPVGVALDLLGEKWTLLIVRDALNGIRRFEEFRRHMGMSEAILADRLQKLVEAGVLEPRAYREPGKRERFEYRITARGRDLLPVIVALKQWGETHFPDPEGAVVEVHHRACGGDVRVMLSCQKCAQAELTTRDTFAEPGPGARPANAPSESRR
jgi:DNA-binding HxlR family transcriptional regulator